jgi:hypothetical protein
MEYVVINIGCLECGVDSDIVGVFDDFDEAQIVADKLADRLSWRQGGQNKFSVFRIPDGINPEYAPHLMA